MAIIDLLRHRVAAFQDVAAASLEEAHPSADPAPQGLPRDGTAGPSDALGPRAVQAEDPEGDSGGDLGDDPEGGPEGDPAASVPEPVAIMLDTAPEKLVSAGVDSSGASEGSRADRAFKKHKDDKDRKDRKDRKDHKEFAHTMKHKVPQPMDRGKSSGGSRGPLANPAFLRAMKAKK